MPSILHLHITLRWESILELIVPLANIVFFYLFGKIFKSTYLKMLTAFLKSAFRLFLCQSIF